MRNVRVGRIDADYRRKSPEAGGCVERGSHGRISQCKPERGFERLDHEAQIRHDADSKNETRIARNYDFWVICALIRVYPRPVLKPATYFAASAVSIAARNSGASGVTLLGKNATILPSRPITYLLKFHAGRLPEVPRYP